VQLALKLPSEIKPLLLQFTKTIFFIPVRARAILYRFGCVFFLDQTLSVLCGRIVADLRQNLNFIDAKNDSKSKIAVLDYEGFGEI